MFLVFASIPFVVLAALAEEQEQAAHVVRESEERFRLVARTAPVMIWMAGTDRLYTYVNQPWLEFTGRPLEVELGNGWAEGVHNEDLKLCLEIYSRALDRRQGKALDIEMAAFEKFSPATVSLYLPNLQRYRTASQRALAKSLELLAKQSPAASEETEDEAPDTSTLESEDAPQTSNLAKPIVTVTEEHPSHPRPVTEDEVMSDKAA